MFNTGGSVENVEIHRASNNKPELFDGEVLSELTSWLSSNRAATTTIALRVRGRGRFRIKLVNLATMFVILFLEFG